jgi:hypothetical protein
MTVKVTQAIFEPVFNGDAAPTVKVTQAIFEPAYNGNVTPTVKVTQALFEVCYKIQPKTLGGYYSFGMRRKMRSNRA